MIIGSMKEVFLTRSKEIFLFDFRIAGLDPQTIDAYQEVLDSFIHFTGDIRVRQLTPDHVGMYIANLSDGPYESEEHNDWVMSEYSVIQTWIQWMYSQKFITERASELAHPPDLIDLFPARSIRGLAYCY